MQKIHLYIYILVIHILCLGIGFEHKAIANEDNKKINLENGLTLQINYAQEQSLTLAIFKLTIDKEYYAYAPGNPEDVGAPISLIAYDHKNNALPVYLPAGHDRRDNFQIDKIIKAYTDELVFFVNLGENIKPKTTFPADFSLLLCSAKHCLPVHSTLTLTVPENLKALDSSLSQDFLKAKALGNVNENVKAKAIEIDSDEKSNGTSLNSGKLHKILNSEKLGTLGGKNTKWEFNPQAFEQELEISGLGKAILFGLLAGLILNLMPCVLPVLTLKIQSFLISEEGEKRFETFRTHNIYFALGILTQFFLLAIILGSAGFMWGELFQNLYFVASLLIILFVLALSLLGLFNLPMFDLKTSNSSSPRRQAFMTGMVATLLATPCSGPFLGGVLSYAFLQPLHLIVLIIMAVGLGMSLPYLLFAYNPKWVNFMPKPGAWMLVLEKIVAFFLLGTVIYMFSILPTYTHISILIALLFVAFIGWIWGTFGSLNASRWRRRILGSIFLLVIICAIPYTVAPPPMPSNATVAWEKFNAQSFREQLGKKALLLEFTADWCPNCKYVEKTVLTGENLAIWQEQYDLTFIQVDLTRNDDIAEALLHELGSKSIPLTAIFATGQDSTKPLIIRDIYSKDDLDRALQKVLEEK